MLAVDGHREGVPAADLRRVADEVGAVTAVEHRVHRAVVAVRARRERDRQLSASDRAAVT